MPPIGDLFNKPDDMEILFKMFGMRIKLWDGETLNVDDQQLWNAVKNQVPDWALCSGGSAQ